MPALTKENVIFDSKLSPGWFSVAEGAEIDAYDWNPRNWKGNILKSGCEKLTDFCGTCHGHVILSIGSDHVLVTVFFKEDPNPQNLAMKNMIFPLGIARPNQPRFQRADMSKNFWTNKI